MSNCSDSSNRSIAKLGNTDQVLLWKKQVAPSKKYCFTYNNYRSSDLEQIQETLNMLGTYCFGLEVGESGTPHLQGWMNFRKKTRITELKDYKFLNKFHWEKQKGKDNQAITYCLKDGNYKTNFNVDEYLPPEPLNIITDLYEWQNEILEIVSEPANPRFVYWIYEEIGNVGKSSFSKYLCHHFKATYIDEGKKSDLINVIYNVKIINSKSIIVIDVPRNNFNKVSYKAIEQIKNGMICNTKYETGMRLFNSPHVVIFCNFAPELDKLSADRWKIAQIYENKLIWE